MQCQQLETTDIFKGALFLCHGGRLMAVRFRARQRRIASFLIEGEGILDLDLDYRNGTAQVNAVEFRQTLNHLRDVLFTRLRESKRGRTRYDNRQRDDRGHQAWR